MAAKSSNGTLSNLKSIRLKRGLSRSALAALSGVLQDTIEAAEQRNIDPGTSKSAKLAQALGVTIETLMLPPEPVGGPVG